MQIEKIDKFRALVARDPSDELARFTLARALFDAGRFADARAEFTIVIDQKPDWMLARILLGRAAMELGDKDAARAALVAARALAVEQNHTEPQLEIDELLLELDA